MKRLFALSAIVFTSLQWVVAPVSAELVTLDEAEQIGQNWVQCIIGLEGSWNNNVSANVSEVSEFRNDDRLLGYYCRVEPSGFVLVSSLKGTAPVKAYSGSSYLDHESNEGPAGMFKFKLEETLHEVELQAGNPETVSAAEVQGLFAGDQSRAWQMLNVPTDDFMRRLPVFLAQANYEEGDTLMSSEWHQFEPYFNMCPAAHPDCPETHCTVGCVALAAAEIMRYWSWPPGRDWRAMPDKVYPTSSEFEKNTVAELCAAIGLAVGMDYCSDSCASSVATAEMEGVYEGWAYADCAVARRADFDHTYWWEGPGMMKAQLNANRPIQYRILGHSIVLHGWQGGFDFNEDPWMYINYGWRDSTANAWYIMDQLLQVSDTGTFAHEYMIIGIVPNVALGGYATGDIPADPGWPLRYVDRDCVGTNALFRAGQLIQFLPDVQMACSTGYVRFEGSPAHHSVLYTPEYSRGVRIEDGAIMMYERGAIKFKQRRR